jgi:hypothetical protein
MYPVYILDIWHVLYYKATSELQAASCISCAGGLLAGKLELESWAEPSELEAGKVKYVYKLQTFDFY